MSDTAKQPRQPMIRRLPDGRLNGGDLDTGRQLFVYGMVWDGNVVSKESRKHFVANGYAVHAGGYAALTGRGIFAMLHPRCWPFWYRVWRRRKQSPFITDAPERALG